MDTKKITPHSTAIEDMRAAGLDVSFFAYDTTFDGRCVNGCRDLTKLELEEDIPLVEIPFTV